MNNRTPADDSEITKIAPQFLVDDLTVAIAYYRDKLGFQTDFVYESFYAGVSRDGLSIHLKRAPKIMSDRAHRKRNEHLDAHICVRGIESLSEGLQSKGAIVVQPPWPSKDFYVEDPDGYILGFSEGTA